MFLLWGALIFLLLPSSATVVVPLVAECALNWWRWRDRAVHTISVQCCYYLCQYYYYYFYSHTIHFSQLLRRCRCHHHLCLFHVVVASCRIYTTVFGSWERTACREFMVNGVLLGCFLPLALTHSPSLPDRLTACLLAFLINLPFVVSRSCFHNKSNNNATSYGGSRARSASRLNSLKCYEYTQVRSQFTIPPTSIV